MRAITGAASGFTMGAGWQETWQGCAGQRGGPGVSIGIEIGAFLAELEII